MLDRIRERFQAVKSTDPARHGSASEGRQSDRDHSDVKFTFLGYAFRPRKAVDKYGRVYVTHAVKEAATPSRPCGRPSGDPTTHPRATRAWTIYRPCSQSRFLRGWQQYYGRFHGSALKPVPRDMNLFLIRWLMRKHNKLARHKAKAAEMLKRLCKVGRVCSFILSPGFLS